MSEKLFSVVTAMYNVEKYLGDFFGSLERQTCGIEKLEVIVVDDGSTDGSGRIAAEFAARHPGVVQVIRQDNAGASAARNRGLAAATGTWVTFADSDDYFADHYFEKVEAHMGVDHLYDPAIYVTHLVSFSEETGEISDVHPLRRKFELGNGLSDLSASPQAIQLHVNCTFFRRSVLDETGIEFDIRVRPRFEDAHFVSRYLMETARPVLGIVAETQYIYRRRADGTSAMQTSHADPRLYTDVPKYGPLDLLKRAHAKYGRVPAWVQFVVLYDLIWLLKSDQRVRSLTASADAETCEIFHGHVKEILQYVDDDTIGAFDVIGVATWIREALILGYRDGSQLSDRVDVGVPDVARRMIPVRYRFTGELPTEEIIVRGQFVQPQHTKIRHYEFMGRVLIKERTLWISSRGAFRIRLDGESRELRLPRPNRPEHRVRTSEIATLERRSISRVPGWIRHSDRSVTRDAAGRVRARLRLVRAAFSGQGIADRWTSFLLRTWIVRRRFGNAWVLMDRDTDANDSAEVLYRWLRKNKPDVNAWFVLNKTSPEWKRLKRDGVRVVPYGSFQWKLLLLKTDHLISTHIDNYVVAPLDRSRYGSPRWKFTFLQHGIIKGDISRWLNFKWIDVFVVSTPDEYDFVAGDSAFKFGPREVRLTGLPRHDDLLTLDQSVQPRERRRIVVMPTWRDYLTGKSVGGNERTRNDLFMDSTYAQQWRALLVSDELKAAADAHDLTIAFMPHPNTQPYLADFDLPDHIEMLTYADNDVRDVIAHSVMMVTDYSSIAFNMAYLYRPVVYFQFDPADFYGGSHLERPGYFDYATHGFGPVAASAPDAIARIVEMIERDGVDEEYVARMKATFPVRDGGNSRRVYEAIVALDKPVSFRDASRPAALDSWDA